MEAAYEMPNDESTTHNCRDLPGSVRGRRVRDCDTGGPSIDQDGAEVKGRDAIQKLLGDNFISVDNGRY